MSATLDAFFDDVEVMDEDTKALILRRRRQMLVHSIIYYVMDDNIISDDQWQAWANELRDLQKKYPQDVGYHDEAFKGWDGTSGAFLPLRKDSRAHFMALHLLREHRYKQGYVNHED